MIRRLLVTLSLAASLGLVIGGCNTNARVVAQPGTGSQPGHGAQRGSLDGAGREPRAVGVLTHDSFGRLDRAGA